MTVQSQQQMIRLDVGCAGLFGTQFECSRIIVSVVNAYFQSNADYNYTNLFQHNEERKKPVSERIGKSDGDNLITAIFLTMGIYGNDMKKLIRRIVAIKHQNQK
ncbi:hypothetical protein GJ496_008610 [Pomphorhynchus laevis]|nr:hypothetical protein GJ496_008610 [Pomphorhynchus laevis]